MAKSSMSKILDAIQKADDQEAGKLISAEIDAIMRKYKLDDYDLVMLYDENDQISNYHANAIYSHVTEGSSERKNILLIINSSGGRIEPAYKISKTLKRVSKEKFAAVIPRRAKSAATLITLGADEVHMGMMSELGPIDPQIAGLPALSLGNALELIADISCKFPDSTNLLHKYLADQIPIRILGYYQRVNESAVQYAERLLNGKKFPDKMTENNIADHFVNHYKDHSFVIDHEEAKELLGDIVIFESDEYKAADEIYKLLDMISFVAGIDDRVFWIVGDKGNFHSRVEKDEG